MHKPGLRALVTRPREDAGSLSRGLGNPGHRGAGRTPDGDPLPGAGGVRPRRDTSYSVYQRKRCSSCGAGQRRASGAGAGGRRRNGGARSRRRFRLCRERRGRRRRSRPFGGGAAAPARRAAASTWPEMSLPAILSACCARRDLPSRDVFSTRPGRLRRSARKQSTACAPVRSPSHCFSLRGARQFLLGLPMSPGSPSAARGLLRCRSARAADAALAGLPWHDRRIAERA